MSCSEIREDRRNSNCTIGVNDTVIEKLATGVIGTAKFTAAVNDNGCHIFLPSTLIAVPPAVNMSLVSMTRAVN